MELTPYLFFTGLSLICNSFVCIFFGFREGKIAQKQISIFTILETISIVLGAKLLDVVTHWNFYLDCVQKADWLRMLTVGYTFLGGVIGAILCVLIYAVLAKEDAIALANLFLPNLLLVYAIAKIGCYYNGCCGGIAGIQLIEAIGYACLFAGLRIQKISSAKRLAWTGILSGAFRFGIEFLRENTGYLPISISQVLALCICLTGIWSEYTRKKKT